MRFSFLLGGPIALVVLHGCGGGATKPGPAGDPPRVSCPADVVVHGAFGPSQPVSFPPPTVQAGTPPTSVACTPASESPFPVGTTAVKCTATDSASRTATCTFNVTLTGIQLAVTRFVAFGDSVTEGQNGRFAFGLEIVDTPNAYPTKLQLSLNTAFPNEDIVVLNRGVGGEPIESGKARLPGVLAKDTAGAVLLLEGYNNLIGDCPPVVTSRCSTAIETVAGTLREMVRIARGAPYGINFVFVATLTPPGPPPTSGSDRRISADAITRVNAKIRQQIPSEGGIVVDVYPLFLGHEREYVAPDGLHLEPPGNDALAGAFFDAIKSVVPQSPLLRAAAAFRR